MPTYPAPHQLSDRSNLTLSTAAEIGAALPHLLGFHPEQSIICLWLKRRQLEVTEQADAPDDDPATCGEQFTEYVHALFAPVRAHDVDGVIVVYVAQEPEFPGGPVRVLAACCPVPVRVHLHMRGARIRDCTPGSDHGESLTVDRYRRAGTGSRVPHGSTRTRAGPYEVGRGRGVVVSAT